MLVTKMMGAKLSVTFNNDLRVSKCFELMKPTSIQVLLTPQLLWIEPATSLIIYMKNSYRVVSLC